MSIVLAIETSSNIGSIALVDDGNGRGNDVHCDFTRDATKLSAWLIPAIAALLERAHVSLAEVDAFAFGDGPGAFTGVRTACATAQSLAYASKKPLYAVNSLHALAQAALTASSVNARVNWGNTALNIILDARMNELYAQTFSVVFDEKLAAHSSLATVVPQNDIALMNAQSLSVDFDSGITVGSGALVLLKAQSAASERIANVEAITHHAETHWAHGVAALALRAIARGERGIDPRDAQPNYVRNRVAQTEAERRSASLAAHL